MLPYEKLLGFYFDQIIICQLSLYFWPMYQLGMQDDWIKLGITLNGARPIC